MKRCEFIEKRSAIVAKKSIAIGEFKKSGKKLR